MRASQLGMPQSKQGLVLGNAGTTTTVRTAVLVAKDGDLVVGWAALSPLSSRDAYSGVAEVSVYVAKKLRGQGAGQLLLNHLVSASESAGVWTLQSSIFVENEASIAIHAACGFRSVGTRERIGCLYGRWRDTLLMERRSSVIGA